MSLGFLPFEHEAISAATEVDLPGIRLPVVRAEDLVIFKAVAWRPIDREDVAGLLALWGSSIDLARVRSWVRQFAEALEDPTRVAEFESVVRNALDS